MADLLTQGRFLWDQERCLQELAAKVQQSISLFHIALQLPTSRVS